MLLDKCNLFYKKATSKFDFEEFKKINNVKEILIYLNKFLKKLGEGSSRVVFDLNNQYVIKAAILENIDEGTHQNESEAKVSKILNDVVAHVVNNHKDYLWIIVEKAKPLKDQKELINVLNLSSPLDLGLLFAKFPPKGHKLLKEPNPIALKVSKLTNNKILPRDVIKSDSWGFTLDNRLVLIDYGKLK